MSERKIPSYRRHKASGQAIVTLTDGLGGRRDVLLGPWKSKESRAEYARAISEWEAAARTFKKPGSDLTVNELCQRFWPHAQERYRGHDGKPTYALDDWKLALRPLRRLYGHMPAQDFGPLALKAVREEMVRQPITQRVRVKGGEWQEKVIRVGLSRGVVNQRVGRIKWLFRWAVENELVPSPIYQALAAVEGLHRGRSKARETEKVKPVPQAFVDAVLPHVLAPIKALIELQALTGMRPGEACQMRACDIDMSGPLWMYRPAHHKTELLGHDRIIPLGKRAQAIIKPFLTLNMGAHLFSPREGMALYLAEKRRLRKSKVQPSQVSRKRKKPKKRLSDHYDTRSYAHAIARACKKAGVPRWSPNRLRHSFATEVRRTYGVEAAQVMLGHQRADVTQVYAERNEALAERVAAEIG
ncbi:MAG: tyrosine-type recombinase/integrase [Gemmataceae bacterium]